MFYKLLLSMLFLCSLHTICFAGISLISPLNDTNLTENNVLFQWENTDKENEYVYRLDIAYYENWSSYSSLSVGNKTQATSGLASHMLYYWRVNYARADIFNGKYPYVSNVYRFGVNQEIPQEEDITPVQEIEEEKEMKESKIVTKAVLKKPSPAVSMKENVNIEEYLDWDTDNISVLGTSTKKVACKFKSLKKKTQPISCKISNLKITDIVQYSFVDEYSVLVRGDFTQDIQIIVEEYKCKRDLLKPISLFKCEEVLVETHTYNVSPYMFFRVVQEDNFVSIKSYATEGDQFSLVAGYFRNKKNLRMEFKYFVNIYDFDIHISGGGAYSLDPKSLVPSKSKPFSFPLDKIIGVTQWHGNTAFQKPHKGIDFGATRENVLAVYEGEVIGKGWDSYNSDKCFSGGNYLLIKQGNGMYTAYFHLEKTFVNTGDHVKKNTKIALSGNSGSWNCQKLGYHLHFETRKARSQTTHVNPVEYINVDWNKVLTLNAKRIPQRLSGDNPHPGF